MFGKYRLQPTPIPHDAQDDGSVGQPVAWSSPLAPFATPKNLPGKRVGPALPNLPQTPQETLPSAVQQIQPTQLLPGVQSVFDRHRYAYPNEGNFVVPASTVQSTKVVDAAANRRNFLLIRNTDSVSNVLVSFGQAASQVTTLSLAPGQTVLFDTVVPQGDIWVLSSGATASVSISYSNLP